MDVKEEFLLLELAWVRVVRKTSRPERLHLAGPAEERERAILAELARLRRGHESKSLVGGLMRSSNEVVMEDGS